MCLTPDYIFYEALSHLNISNLIISSTKYNIICLNINAASALQKDHNCSTCIAKLNPCTQNWLTNDLPVSEGKSVDQSTYLKVKDISDKPEHMLILFVCFITKSFLTYSFFSHLHLLYQPYLGLCQAQCVQSHQTQPMSAVAITACEVQVSAADSQTVPTVATGV